MKFSKGASYMDISYSLWQKFQAIASTYIWWLNFPQEKQINIMNYCYILNCSIYQNCVISGMENLRWHRSYPSSSQCICMGQYSSSCGLLIICSIHIQNNRDNKRVYVCMIIHIFALMPTRSCNPTWFKDAS